MASHLGRCETDQLPETPLVTSEWTFSLIAAECGDLSGPEDFGSPCLRTERWPPTSTPAVPTGAGGTNGPYVTWCVVGGGGLAGEKVCAIALSGCRYFPTSIP